jgi:uncharacterized membrane protein (DUF485 family)
VNIDENKGITFGGTLSAKEFIRYNFYHSKKFIILYFWLILLMSLGFLGIKFSGQGIALTLIGSLITVVIGIPIFCIVIYFRARKEFNSDQLIKSEIQYVANDDGINQKRGKSNSYFEWNDIISSYEDKELFRLYVSKNKAIIIPKRYFSSEEDLLLFKRLITKHLNLKKANSKRNKLIKMITSITLVAMVLSSFLFPQLLIRSHLLLTGDFSEGFTIKIKNTEEQHHNYEGTIYYIEGWSRECFAGIPCNYVVVKKHPLGFHTIVASGITGSWKNE